MGILQSFGNSTNLSRQMSLLMFNLHPICCNGFNQIHLNSIYMKLFMLFISLLHLPCASGSPCFPVMHLRESLGCHVTVVTQPQVWAWLKAGVCVWAGAGVSKHSRSLEHPCIDPQLHPDHRLRRHKQTGGGWLEPERDRHSRCSQEV